jgi:hypothetical protein
MPTKKKATPRLAKRFIVPFLSESLGQLAGEELEKIAIANKINNIQHLNKEMVLDEVLKNPKHRLRAAGYIWDVKKAARRNWLDHTQKLISGVRSFTVNISKKKIFEPMFVSAQAPVRQQGSQALRQSHIFRPDMLASDPIFLSALGSKLRRFVGVLKELEHLTASRPAPPDVAQLLLDVRTSVDNCASTVSL